MTVFEHVRYDVADGVATLTLHRPDKLNAVNSLMLREMIAAFDRGDEDDAVRAVIVTGAGHAFCAGADLSGGGQTFARETSAEEHRDGGGQVTLRIFDLEKPVIAAFGALAIEANRRGRQPLRDAKRIALPTSRRAVSPLAAGTALRAVPAAEVSKPLRRLAAGARRVIDQAAPCQV